MMVVTRNHGSSWNLINVRDDLFVRNAGKIDLDERHDLVADKAILILARSSCGPANCRQNSQSENNSANFHHAYLPGFSVPGYMSRRRLVKPREFVSPRRCTSVRRR